MDCCTGREEECVLMEITCLSSQLAKIIISLPLSCRVTKGEEDHWQLMFSSMVVVVVVLSFTLLRQTRERLMTARERKSFAVVLLRLNYITRVELLPARVCVFSPS